MVAAAPPPRFLRMNPSIRPVTLEDIIGLDRYARDRAGILERTIAIKKHRRVVVGDSVLFVFENHATIFFQIQEMLRVERITDLDAVREELEVYNALLPQPNELSSTMMIQITEQDQIESRLQELIGIDEHVVLEAGGHSVRAEFEPGRSREDRLSAVQYVRFRCPPPLVDAFCDPSVAAKLTIDHPNYRADVSLEGETRASLARDLEPA